MIRYIREQEPDRDNPFAGRRILVIHSGSDSRRVPQYSATGKLFAPVPRELPNGHGSTLFDEFVTGVEMVMGKAPVRSIGEDGLPVPPYALYNIGNNNPENLLDFVQILSEELVRAGVLPEDCDFETHKELVPMQPGDVPVTYADTSALERDFGFKPSTTLRTGLRKFAKWYREFYM